MAAGRLITKRYLLTDLVGTAYDSTSAVMGQTTAYDRASNKHYERALHAESRSHLYSSGATGSASALPYPFFFSRAAATLFARRNFRATTTAPRHDERIASTCATAWQSAECGRCCRVA